MSHPQVSSSGHRTFRDTGVLSLHLAEVAGILQRRNYVATSIQRYLREAAAFSRWFVRQRRSLHEFNEQQLERYLRLQVPAVRRRQVIRRGVHFVFVHLRALEAIPSPSPVPHPTTAAEHWVKRYHTYLATVLGLAPTTQQQYCRFAARLLTWLNSGDDEIDWTTFTAERIIQFVTADAAPRRGFGPQTTTSGVRAFLRFLVMEGQLPAGLEHAMPPIRRWSHAALPHHLSESEISRVLTVCQDGTAIGLRNYAIVMLLARLGLRAKEVARLQLADVDWTTGSLLIRSSKTHTERVLPLAQDVGEALLAYLRNARPRSTERDIFLEHTAPYTPLQTASAITKLVQRLLRKAGIVRRSSGAHLFRHTAATQMVNHGVSFKAVADILGHQQLLTTSLYAKLDLTTLAEVTLSWPGGAQ
jgi:site-specific recombinase XerD